ISGSITAQDKVYDRSTAATLTSRTLSGQVAGDNVSLQGGTATFDTKNVGTNQTVTATGLYLFGTDAGNYTLSNPTNTTQASISKRDLTVTATGVNKVYDATTDAQVILSTGALTGDDVTASDNTAFADKNVGVDKPLHVTNISISGADAGNYHLTNT